MPLLVLLTMAACGGSVAGAPGAAASAGAAPAPRATHGGAPYAVEVSVGDSGDVMWNRTTGVLDDSLYRFGSGSPRRGYVTAFSLARRISLRLDFTPAGDSTRIAVSGRHYVGDRSRPGRVSARFEDWAPITARDADREALRHFADALLAPPAAEPAPVVGRSTSIVLADVRMGACTYSNLPAGWVTVEWYTDPAHCPYDPYWKYKGDPNMTLIERVR